ncbi:MAG: HPr family phosphocarrier protein [Oscillospiraceae bacterium]|nr:HPr family phosphocarrier protein [Oscillospiraceae bacterium]
MEVRDATIENELGLFARPATFFIQKANEFKSTVWVDFKSKRVNAKSLLGVLSLAVGKGDTIKIVAEGPDEKEAVESIVKIIDNYFADYEQKEEDSNETS